MAFFGAGVGDRRRGRGNVDLHRVRERVHAGCGGQRGRHRHHQARIVDGDERRAAPIDDRHFHVIAGVGDDAESCHLCCRARRRVDRNQRRHRHRRFVDPFIVADMSASGGDEPDAFRAVVRRPAAERNDEVAPLALIELDAVVDVDVGRIGLRAREDDGLQADEPRQIRAVEVARNRARVHRRVHERNLHGDADRAGRERLRIEAAGDAAVRDEDRLDVVPPLVDHVDQGME